MSDTTTTPAPPAPDASPTPDAPPVPDTVPPALAVDLGPVPTKVWRHLHSVITAFALDCNGWTIPLSRSRILTRLFRPAGRRNCFGKADLDDMLPRLKARGFATESPDGLRFKCPSRIEASGLISEFYRAAQGALCKTSDPAVLRNPDMEAHNLALAALKDAAVRAEAMRANGVTGQPLGRAKTPIKPGVSFYTPKGKICPASARSSFPTPTRAREDDPAVTTS